MNKSNKSLKRENKELHRTLNEIAIRKYIDDKCSGLSEQIKYLNQVVEEVKRELNGKS